MASKRASRSTPYKSQHGLKYGVKVCQYSTDSPNEVLAAECQFCVYYGREVKVGLKRKQTGNVKYFKHPFRADNYLQHLNNQHCEKWKEYQTLNEKEKKEFFTGTPIKSTIHGFFGAKQVSLKYCMNKKIVEVLIGDMLWSPDLEDELNLTKERMMQGFESCIDISEGEDANGNGDSHYSITIANRIQWQLAIDYLGASLSFTQAARVMQSTKERTGLASIGNCTKNIISKYARFSCAINLQKLSDLLQSTWTFSVAMDMSTHMETGYLDIRIRIFTKKNGIVNAHVLAIPVFDRHTGEVVFNTAAKALDCLDPLWRQKVIGISTDRENKMTGRYSGVATRFQQVANPGFIRIWCGAHQLDIVLQSIYSKFGDEKFYTTLTKLIGYLRCQFNLIQEMKTKAPTLSDTRWESMNNVSNWFKTNRIQVEEYLQQKSPACTPPSEWWIQIMIIAVFAKRAKICFRQLQGHTCLVAAQRQHLSNLCEDIVEFIEAKGPLSLTETKDLEEKENEIWLFSTEKKFASKLDSVIDFVLDQGSFVLDKIEALDDTVTQKLYKDVGLMFLDAIEGIKKIQAERSETNDAAQEKLPSVLVHEILDQRQQEFCAVVRSHRDRLLTTWTPVQIDELEQQCADMCAAIKSERVLHGLVQKSTQKTSFEDSWKVLNGRFPLVEQFCGGIGTVFPGTSQVESDFSLVKGAKTEHKMSLTDLSLEGVLHAKQMTMLAAIDV